MGVWGFFEAEWPLLLCALIVCSCVAAAILVLRKYEAPFLRKNLDRGEVDNESALLYSSDLYKCFGGKLHWAWLAAFRLAAFFYLLGVQIYDLALHGYKTYLFYTQWSFTLLIIYFGLASYLSAQEFWNTKKDDGPADEEVEAGTTLIPENNPQDRKLTDSSPVSGRIGYATHIIFQVAIAASVFTDAVYWFILVPMLPDRYEFNFININMHAVNAIFLFCEFIANTMPFPWFRGAYFVFWTAAYVLLQWIIHAAGFIRWWPYPFLEVHTQYAPGWYIVLAVSHLMVLLFCLGLARAKRSLGKFSNRMLESF